MIQEIKKFFLYSIRQNKKELILALLFFIIFGLFLPYQPTLAQKVPGLSCSFWDVGCHAANFILSILIKIVVLTVFGIPLIISALFVGIMGLILGWVLSPDFISLKFTQNPFVDIGLSITKGFANMGFILFLVVIALATVLRIEQYKAKKTLITLIIIALLINFSPVFCGIIIDFSNIVMKFFTDNITGLTGFMSFINSAFLQLWDLLVTSGFDAMANLSAATQILISIIFNFFAGYVFLILSALFIMRYVMLWIIVILSPIAFLSYILPITRGGKSILNWKNWLEQLIEWCLIGVTAGFFVYLGFTMITMVNANPHLFVTPFGTDKGLGIVDNILPYLIPLILLAIGYKEAKKTSAMFAREMIDTTEKIGKTAVTAAAMVAMTAATAGAGAALGAARGTPGAIGAFQKRMDTFSKSKEHKDTTGGHIAGWMSKRAGSLRGKDAEGNIDTNTWVGKGREYVGERVGNIVGGVKGTKNIIGEWAKRQADEKQHPDRAAVIGWMKKQAKKGFNTAILGKGEKEVEDRPLNEAEKNQVPDANGKKYRYERKKEKEPFSPQEREDKMMTMPDGTERKLEKEDLDRGYVWRETNEWVANKDKELTDKELKSQHLTEMVPVATPGLAPVFKNAMKTIGKGLDEAIEDRMNKLFNVVSLKLERELEKVNELIAKAEAGEEITDSDVSDMDWARKIIEKGDKIDEEKLRKHKAVLEKKKGKDIKQGGTKLQLPKASDMGSNIGKIFRKKPKKDETQQETEEDDSSDEDFTDEIGG
jgi:hypothetical protein